MNNPLAKLYSWQVSSGQLDGWTSYHLAAGLFIAKVAQWLGASDLWAVLWVLIIGILWEIRLLTSSLRLELLLGWSGRRE